MAKNKIWRISTILMILSIMVSGFVGITAAKTDPWWSDVFYTARSIDGSPVTGYVKGDVISLDLENELDFQTVYIKRVAQIKNLDTKKIVQQYTILPNKMPIAFGGKYSSTWTPNKAGRYQACTEVINSKNNKKVRCTQIMIVYNSPTPALAIGVDKSSYKTGDIVFFSLTDPGTLSVYLDSKYTIMDIDHGKSYTFNADISREELSIEEGLGFRWDQKNNNGVQVSKGKYKIRWYWSETPGGVKNKYSDSKVFKIK